MQGTAEVKDGYYIETTTNGSQRFAPYPRSSRFLFVRMSDRELVLKSDRQGSEMIWRRQK